VMDKVPARRFTREEAYVVGMGIESMFLDRTNEELAARVRAAFIERLVEDNNLAKPPTWSEDDELNQRVRLEGGRFQMFRQHSPIVLGKYIQTGKMRYLDELMELLTPPLSFLLIMQFILFAGALLMYTSWIPIFLATFTVEVFYVLSGQILRKAPLSLWMYLLAAPLFLMSKVPVYLKLIKREETKQWDRTERISELNSRERIEPDEN